MTRVRSLLSIMAVMLLPAVALAGDDEPTPAVAKKPAEPPTPAGASRAEIKRMFGFVPAFLNAVPDNALPGAWEEMKTVQMNPSTALPPKIKELIGLAVSAQVPCKYCVYAHTQFAKLHGASDAEVKEAVMVAAQARHWSTMAQGLQMDLKLFRAEIAKVIAHAKQSAGKPPPAAIQVVDARSAMQDMQQTLGYVPEFLRKFPAEGIAGAWKEMRDVVMSPATAIPAKYKTLIGIAVASQIPCRYCLAADGEFAKLEGTTEREVIEAVAMAAITRHWSTYLNGVETDEAQFKRDVDRMVKAAKKQAGAAKQPVAAAPTARPAAAQ